MTSSRVERWFVGVVTGAFIVGVAGCAGPQVEEAAVEKEPDDAVVRSFPEIEDLTTLTDSELLVMGELGTFMADNGLVDIEVRWGDDSEAPAECNRELYLWRTWVSIFPDSVEGPDQVIWLIRLMKNDPELWMQGDTIFVEAKGDRCFAMEPFAIKSPLRPTGSGAPDICWRPGDARVWWEYSVELRNPACVTEENPAGTAYLIDPVVVIDPGGI